MNLTALSISLVIVILIALVCELAGPFAAGVLAAAPTGTPLSLYYASLSSNPHALASATDGLITGTACTLFFAFAARQAAHSGLTLLPTLLAGYLAWGISYCLLSFVSSQNRPNGARVSEIRPAE
jgi:hypothetical protein